MVCLVLPGGQVWNVGYRYLGMVQIILTGIFIFSLPLWKGRTVQNQDREEVGLIANHIHPGIYPFYLAVVLVLMATMHTKLCKIKSVKK